MVAALLIGGVFLLGMVVATGYAARTLPSGARVPLNAGVVEYSVWLSKPAGLASWLGIGVVTYAIFGTLTLIGLFSKGAESVEIVLLPCIMMVMLALEAGAVNVARWTAEGVPTAGTPAAPMAAETSEVSAAESESEAVFAETETEGAPTETEIPDEPTAIDDSELVEES